MSIVWKDIPDYEGYYQASSCGKIRSLDRVVSGRWGPTKLRGKVLQPTPDNYGHLKVDLSKDGKAKPESIHHLVAITWFGPVPEGQEVRHGLNGKTDNSVSNLSYGTHSDNMLDCRRDGTSNARRVRRSDGIEFASMREAAEASGCSISGICHCCAGRKKTAGSYGWEYI